MSDVAVGEVSLSEYSSIVGDRKIEEIRTLAANLRGKSVCHINSTAFGGGVAEILHQLVPLMSDVGLKADWKVIKGSDEFFNVTKAFHNGLQGMNIPLTDQMRKIYLDYNEKNAQELDVHNDFVIIHDFQPAALIMHYKIKLGKWIWRGWHPAPDNRRKDGIFG